MRTAVGIRDTGFEQPAGLGIRTAHSERIPNPKSQIPTLNAIADTADGIRDSGFGIRTAVGIRASGFEQAAGFGIRTAQSERIPNPKPQIPTLIAIADTADGIRDSGFGIRTAVGTRASGFELPAGFGIRTAHSERIPNPKSQIGRATGRASAEV